MDTLVVYHLRGETGWSTVCVNGKPIHRRLACTICTVHSKLQRESGTSFTIGQRPGTGRKRQNGTHFPFRYSGWKLWTTSQDVLFILEIFQSGKPK